MTVVERPKGKGPQATTPLPLCHKNLSHPLRIRLGSACSFTERPPDNIAAIWEMSRSGPETRFMDRHTRVAAQAFLLC